MEHPFKSSANQHLFSIVGTAKLIENGRDFFVTDVGVPVNIEEVLLFEPYAKLGASVLQELFSDKNTKLLASVLHC